jgi:hypothetical protein
MIVIFSGTAKSVCEGGHAIATDVDLHRFTVTQRAPQSRRGDLKSPFFKDAGLEAAAPWQES